MGTKMLGPTFPRGLVGPGERDELMGASEPVGLGISELRMGSGVKPLEGSTVLMLPVMEGRSDCVADWTVVAGEL